ncbi:hypothetical protein GX645_01775 [Candidatus Sumerlaeota bacterium]|nr:hypothetical protein [Candidatus Sumerlaeota bacterium]
MMKYQALTILFTVIAFTAMTSLPETAISAPAKTTQQQVIKHKRESFTFHSKALDAISTCTVFTPDPMVKGERYPVLYLLHGYSGDNNDWADRTSCTLALTNKKMIVVLPNGDYKGWYVDSPLIKEYQYDSLVAKDVVAEIDQRYPTIAKREARAVAGLSMGGHGAITLAEKHPDVFCSASSLSGVLTLHDWLPKYYLEELLGPTRKEKAWADNCAYCLSDTLTTANIEIMFDCGTSDICYNGSAELDEKLTALGVKHTFNRTYPGVHSWAYWDEHLPEHVLFHYNNMTEKLSGKNMKIDNSTMTPQQKLYKKRWLQFEKETATYYDDPKATSPIVLLGSSTLQIFNEKELMPGLPVVNRGISGDRIGIDNQPGISHRIYNTVIKLKPRAIIINNGTNDLAHTAKTGTPKTREVIDEYRWVVARLLKELPNCHIFINSCHPTNDSSATIAPFIWQYNILLQNLAKEMGDHVHYIDHANAVKDENGLLKKEFAADGLHLNAKGNEVLRDKIMEALKEQGILDGLQ